MPKSDAEGLYQVPALYEALLGADGSDEAWYRGLAERVGGPVLDLGCGQGRLSLALAADGHAVTGVDASAAMLASARAGAAARGLAVDWVEVRWEQLGLPSVFSLALLPYNGLQHLHDDAALRAVSRSVRASLKPGGLWALDLHVPQPSLLDRDPQAWLPVEAGPRGPQGERVVAERSAYDPASRVLTQSWLVQGPDGERVLSLGLRQYPVDLLQAFFAADGWRVEGLYQSFDQRPLGPQALRQCWALRAPA
jgi:SAM-dependent methyltransferase